ncbi:RNA polymerase sigma factor [Gracilibacillus caseinilyticus]|uniref:RNA polymerase sigma factor n=1 Tax=Gracilibacillus caseinilyticus TaxID=2932256 RepID=A0ABY4F2Y9_9BACI|nr:RNA polymerase sigma factor [Gracilibacillus caseinilyticus]UOQ48806.1 RNA polymerase sigma factor [Gracilibacillus caseinilyticus]
MTNEEYIEELYIEYSKHVSNYINSILNNYHQAEDLMQETFIRALVKINTLKKEANVKPWLFRIAHNIAIDHVRRQKVLNNCLNELRSNSVRQWHPDVLAENNMDFINSLEKLKKSYKQVIIFRKLLGYTTDETGEQLNWSTSKVKTTLSRATYYFKKQLIEDEQVIIL